MRTRTLLTGVVDLRGLLSSVLNRLQEFLPNSIIHSDNLCLFYKLLPSYRLL